MVKAAVMVAPHQSIEIREYPEPEVEPGGVVLRILYSEVCGTDVHLWRGRLAGVPYPLIPGHVSVGVVEEMNGTVMDVEGQPVRSGEIVTFLDVWGSCGSCWYCQVAQASTRCPNRRVYGITMGAEEGLFGGWSEKIYLRPNTHLIRLPCQLDPLRFIGGGCGMPTAFHAVERAQIRLGDTVVVQGSGPVGLAAIVFARLAGALTVINVGGPAHRLRMARALEADITIDIAERLPDERTEAVRAATAGRGADVTIEATGQSHAVAEGMAMTRDAGTYVVAGQYTDSGEVPINPHQLLNRKHLNVLGTWGTDFSHVYRSIQVLARYGQRFPLEQEISRHYGLPEAETALRDVEEQRVVKAVIDPRYY